MSEARVDVIEAKFVPDLPKDRALTLARLLFLRPVTEREGSGRDESREEEGKAA